MRLIWSSVMFLHTALGEQVSLATLFLLTPDEEPVKLEKTMLVMSTREGKALQVVWWEGMLVCVWVGDGLEWVRRRGKGRDVGRRRGTYGVDVEIAGIEDDGPIDVELVEVLECDIIHESISSSWSCP